MYSELLTLALVITASPFPIIALMPILASSRRSVNAPVFLFGWATGIAVVMTLALVLLTVSGVDLSDETDPASWTIVVRAALGITLGFYAIKQWMTRPRAGEAADVPTWIESLGTATTRTTLRVALLLSAANPKVILLTAGGAATIVHGELTGSARVSAVGIFVIVATIGPTIPVAIALVMGARADAVLARLRSWMERNNAVIMAVLFGLLSAKVLSDLITSVS